MTGIYDCFGYGSGYDVSFEERYKLIRKSGFDCVMLWWSNQFGRGDGYREDVRLARSAGLFVENIHAPVHEQNNLSLDNLSGEGVFQSYLQCVADCCEYDIPTMVIHLPNDNNPLNQTGIRRLAELINKAEQKNIHIAFENLSNIKNLKTALNKLEIDEYGLDEIDRRLLEAMIIKYGGRPVGLETMAVTVGEEADTIEDVYEPYLIQIGFITRTPRGRIPLKPAYEHIGVEYNE